MSKQKKQTWKTENKKRVMMLLNKYYDNKNVPAVIAEMKAGGIFPTMFGLYRIRNNKFESRDK